MLGNTQGAGQYWNKHPLGSAWRGCLFQQCPAPGPLPNNIISSSLLYIIFACMAMHWMPPILSQFWGSSWCMKYENLWSSKGWSCWNHQHPQNRRKLSKLRLSTLSTHVNNECTWVQCSICCNWIIQLPLLGSLPAWTLVLDPLFLFLSLSWVLSFYGVWQGFINCIHFLCEVCTSCLWLSMVGVSSKDALGGVKVKWILSLKPAFWP